MSSVSQPLPNRRLHTMHHSSALKAHFLPTEERSRGFDGFLTVDQTIPVGVELAELIGGAEKLA